MEQKMTLPSTKIESYPFTQKGAEDLFNSKSGKGIDWPVVYILDGKEGQKPVAYVGETSSAY